MIVDADKDGDQLISNQEFKIMMKATYEAAAEVEKEAAN